MILTEEQIIANQHISDSEIKKDISDTQQEIDNYTAELKVLRKNPIENKLQIYLKEGNVNKRYDFINHLQQILDYRK